MTTVRDATFDVFRRFGMTTIFANPGSTEIAFLTGLPDDLEFLFSPDGAVRRPLTAPAYAQEIFGRSLWSSAARRSTRPSRWPSASRPDSCTSTTRPSTTRR